MNSWLDQYILIGAIGGAVALIVVFQYWVIRKYRRETEEKLHEAQRRLAEITLASEKASNLTRFGTSTAVAPMELPPVEDNIANALRSGECVLFAGSGVSAQAGLPVWQQTLSAVIAHFESRGGDRTWESVRQKLTEGKLDTVADLISSRVQRTELLEIFAKTYDVTVPRPLPALSQVLGELPFARVLTANWDSIVEETFRHRGGAVLSPDRSERLAAVYRENAFMILKLYGDLSNPKSVSFSAEEYRRSIEDNPDFFKFISTIYASNTILFIGLSLAGIEDFVSALRLRGDPGRLHHALIPWQPDIEVEQERFQSRYSIRLLSFRPTSGFPEVVQWVENLRDRYREQPAPLVQPNAIRQQIVTRLQLENIGSFQTFDQMLNPGWNVLLGNNGLGKSTILKAIAMGFCGGDPKAAKAARGLLRAGVKNGVIRLWLGDDKYESRLTRDGADVRVECDRFTPFQSGTLVALGFPPLRGVSLRNPEGQKQVESPNPVIDDVLPLLLGAVDSRVDNLKQWLVNVQGRIDSNATPQQEAARARQMRDTFFRIMDELSPGLEVSFDHVDTYTWQVMVLTHGGVIPIDWLSQGMISLLAWVGALLERMYEIHSTSLQPENEPGLVLIDEIAAHMHPEWEYAMVPLIRSNFQNLQVIASTHSPLVVANTRKGEVFYLHRAGNEVKIEKLELSFEGLRTDQVLTGPAFRMPTTLDPETKKLRDEYTTLLGRNRVGQHEERFQQLARQLALRIPKPHEREEGREAIKLLEQWMTERIKSKPLEQRQKVVKEAELYFSQLDTGNVSHHENTPSAALENYEEALVTFRAMKDQRGEANTLKAIGDVQSELGEKDTALKTYAEVLALYRELSDRQGEANTLKAVGDIANFRVRHEEAMKNYERALGLFRTINDPIGEARVLRSIGDVRRSTGEVETALEDYEAALTLFRLRGDHAGMAGVLKAIGDLYSHRGDKDGALKNYEEALNLGRAVGDRRVEANTLKAIGDIQSYRGELDAAVKSYNETLGIARALGDRLQVARTLKSLGDLQRRGVKKTDERSSKVP
jgi:tetratricopeptide (TPR) repeat protein